MMDFVQYIPDIPRPWQETAEMLTAVFSLTAMVLTIYLWKFFRADKHPLSKKLANEYFTDFLLYVVTFVMGIGLFFDWVLLVKYDIMIRPLAILLNIIAMWRLYSHYRKM